MQRVFFLYNCYEREHVNISLISEQLKKKGFQVFQGGILEKDIVKQLFLARPHIIFTYPITTCSQIKIYSMAKAIFHAKIITFTTEGVSPFHLDEVANMAAGFYNFPAELVDYHIFWGRYMAKYVGRKLYRQHKLISRDQIKIFGNPMYEKVYPKPSQIKNIDDKGIKVLVITGFHGGSYTEDDLINAQDIVNIKEKSKEEILVDETFMKLKDVTMYEKIYAEKYIKHIIEVANRYPDVLFVIKLHPKEIEFKKYDPDKLKYLKKLENIKNIQIIEESIPVGSLLPYFQLLVHYGSTVDLEAYAYKVPTVKLESHGIDNCYDGHANRRTESTYYVDIDEENAISRFIDRLKNGEELFQQNSLTEKQLYGYMNYKNDEEYKPSAQIADFLSGSLQFNKVHLNIEDKIKYIYLWIRGNFMWRLLPAILKKGKIFNRSV